MSSARVRIDPGVTLSALAMPRTGRIYELGTDLSAEMPHGPRDTFHPFTLSQYRTPLALRDPSHRGFDFSMDVIQGSPHLGSHIDALVHIQADGRIFGGATVAETLGDFGWSQHGAETIPPFVTRGLLLDIPASEGIRRLPDGFEIGIPEIERCLEGIQTQIEQGDVVLFRTGKMLDYYADPDAYFAAGPGLGITGAIWLDEQGVAAIGSDTTATEPVPFTDPANTTHRAMLVDRGVHLFEILDLEAIAADGVTEFLFLCLPLRLVGATGSWVRPIAVV